MLLVGASSCMPSYIENLVVYNLSSMLERVPRLKIVNPNMVKILDYMDEKNFDIQYANYIFSNDEIFTDFMSIIMSLYYGNNVYLLISRSEEIDIINESVCKLIQQRYGYNYQLINEIDDVNEYDDSDFSIFGLNNLDIDKERFSILTTKGHEKDILTGLEVEEMAKNLIK